MKRIVCLVSLVAFALALGLGCAKEVPPASDNLTAKVMNGIETNIQDASLALSSLPVLPVNVIFDMLTEVVEANPSIFGAAYATAPMEITPGNTDIYYVYRQDGKLVQKLDPGYDFEQANAQWFLVPYQTGRPAWSQPYCDSQTTAENSMTTFSYPVFSQDAPDQFMGIMTADLLLAAKK